MERYLLFFTSFEVLYKLSNLPYHLPVKISLSSSWTQVLFLEECAMNEHATLQQALESIHLEFFVLHTRKQRL